MAHANVKPLDPAQTYRDEKQAIQHVFLVRVDWKYDGKNFGQSIPERRAIQKALKEKDYDAFMAERRKGYWKVSLRA